MRLSGKLRLFLSASLAAVIAGATLSAEARKIRTRHAIPKQTAKESASRTMADDGAVSMASDSATFCERILPAIRFYGFDKTAGSNMESFFISNGLDSTVSGMGVRITYYDMKGRQLHKQAVWIDCDIPAGETKRTDIKSWDTQKSFYFHKSAAPKRQATPFDVKIELVSVNISDEKE